MSRERENYLYRSDRSYDGYETDITVLALYVPGADQNTSKPDHAKKEGRIERDISLARQYGISGFAVVCSASAEGSYLEVFDSISKQADTSFSFMAVLNIDSLSSPESFIKELASYMKSSGYLHIDEKPVIGLCYSEKMIFIDLWFNTLRKAARKCGIGEILIWSEIANLRGFFVRPDAFFELPPFGKEYAASCEAEDGGTVHDYGGLVEGARWFKPKYEDIPAYRGSMLAWDDIRVRESGYDCWVGYSPERFYVWNRINIRYLREHFDIKERILFVNAWNDHAHGTYLTPDPKFSHASLNALSRAIFDMHYEEDFDENSVWYLGAGSLRMQKEKEWHAALDEKTLIAVHVHVFYTELLKEVLDFISHIPFRFDLYISCDTNEKKDRILREMEKYNASSLLGAENTYVNVYPNRGRDFAPLLTVPGAEVTKYKYICHIHTKKSGHGNFGSVWRRYLFRNLLGSETLVREIMYMFEKDGSLGMIFPQGFDLVRGSIAWIYNKKTAEDLIERMGLAVELPERDIIFPAGNMFWARTDAVRQMFELGLSPYDFPEDLGQLDGTIMHAMERIWCYIARANGYSYRLTRYLADNRPLDVLKI